MNIQQCGAKFFMLIAVFASALKLVVCAHAADPNANNIEGVIMSRQGDKLVLRGTELGVTEVSITKSTNVYQRKGPLGIVPSGVGADILVPGLKIVVEPELPAQQNVAKSIYFYTSDLETLYAIQGALALPQGQINTLTQELAAQKQHNALQDKAIAESKDADAAINKRVSNLADYDMKSDVNVLFDVNSSTLSEKAKGDLKELAAKAKTYRGYLIQVAAYADSSGTASRNQALSDRRAVTVAQYLQQECDVALSRVLVPIAMGESKPTASNETAQGRAENRRVTVKLGVNRGIGE